jgi:hypothetical protein
VDVKCRNAVGRFFIVEMQMFWSPLFMKRMVFNATQALVKQADKPASGKPPVKFSELQPVYMLAIVNQYFPYKEGERWMYTYQPEFWISIILYFTRDSSVHCRLTPEAV